MIMHIILYMSVGRFHEIYPFPRNQLFNLICYSCSRAVTGAPLLIELTVAEYSVKAEHISHNMCILCS